MQAVLLRPARCLYCGGAMPPTGRIDRRYCKESCRTLSYRHRKRTGEPAKRRERIPKWTEGQPLVIGSALAALADLQGRISQMAHHLERDDIAFRHPYPVEQAQAIIPDDAAQRLEALATELRQARADKATAEDKAQSMNQELTELRREMGQARERLALLSEQVQNAGRQQPQDKIAALRANLAEVTRRADETTVRLEKTEKSLAKQKENAERNFEMMNETSRAAARMRQTVERTTTELQRSAQKIQELEATVAEHQPLAEKLRTAQRANQVLQAEVEKLRPPPAEADPLVKLMKQKVVAWHLLAQYGAQYERKGKGPLFSMSPELTSRPLDRDDAPTILKAAVQAALDARRGFFYRTPGPYAPKPRWIIDDRLLDPTSEKALYEEEERAIESLRSYVSLGKIQSGG